ncbi:tRNA dihydrouridine(20/20a) synthase DusA [Limnobacter parvus]|uniref:tRNA-dihydrouridine(20/20a) synthase n=1 Tax=Limnobacter parvus TaxID=2939690 RepID=A0ABT1XFE1_9BURK|nr:tRNA dihydrouridine(20/20a) synthase DusA [Limnobacter parvus]MCR2746001.1 tRNA dihydrouridine(20/20a) synthase DusA [Limnobacter parvus]
MQNMIHQPRILSVAPMIDWTDRHCRRFHRSITQHTWLYTEMITTGALVFGDRERFLAFNEEEHPLAFQIGGSDPYHLAECAKWIEQAGYDELNLNVGCPSERVQKGAFGACLMAEPALVADCVKAMRDACTLEVTVKHRIGLDYDESETMLYEFVGKVSEAGCQTFIVHARNAVLKGLSPKENRDIPPLRYEVVKGLKQHFPQLQFILNGGITTLDEIQSHLQWADGCMIGREAYSNPWLMSGFDALVGKPTASKTRFDVIDELRGYAEQELAKGESIRNITKSWLGLFHGQPGGRLYRQVLSDSTLLKANSWQVVEDALAKMAKHATA